MQHGHPRIRVSPSLLGDLWRATCACGASFQDPSQHELRIWTAGHARACPELSAAAKNEACRELRALTLKSLATAPVLAADPIPDLISEPIREPSGVAYLLRRLAHR